MYDFLSYLMSLPESVTKKHEDQYSNALLDSVKFCFHEIDRLMDITIKTDIYVNKDLSNFKKAFSNIDYSSLFRFKLSTKKNQFDINNKYDIEYLKPLAIKFRLDISGVLAKKRAG